MKINNRYGYFERQNMISERRKWIAKEVPMVLEVRKAVNSLVIAFESIGFIDYSINLQNTFEDLFVNFLDEPTQKNLFAISNLWEKISPEINAIFLKRRI